MSGFGIVTVNTANPDPAWAIHAFLRVMEKARSCGFSPPTELVLAEQLMRREVKVVFYSTATGATQSYVESEDGLDPDEAFEVMMLVAKKAMERRKRRRAAQGMEAATAGETAPDSAGSIHDSPVRDSGCAQTPPSSTTGEVE